MFLLKVDLLFTEDRCIQICSCIDVAWANLPIKYLFMHTCTYKHKQQLTLYIYRLDRKTLWFSWYISLFQNFNCKSTFNMRWVKCIWTYWNLNGGDRGNAGGPGWLLFILIQNGGHRGCFYNGFVRNFIYCFING